MAQGKIEFFQLRCFVAVAEELNFRRAAERLHMTQPPLSRQIKLLEHAMGLKLLERDSRSVRLTLAGHSLLSSASDILQRAEHAVLIAQQADRGEAGSIVLGFVPFAAIEFVPRIVRAMQQSLPEIIFTPVEMMSYEISEGLVSGQLDLGLTRSANPREEINGIEVVSEHFVLALPTDHHLARSNKLRLSDLDGEKFVGYARDRGAFLRNIHDGLFVTAGITPKTVLEVSQTHTVLSLVNNGIGVALVPASAQAIRMENLAYRRIPVPNRFRSRLFVNTGPRQHDSLHAKVLEVIRGALKAYRPN